jgi:class 3 adenylate cyclase
MAGGGWVNARILFLVAGAVLLAACGGGGPDSSRSLGVFEPSWEVCRDDLPAPLAIAGACPWSPISFEHWKNDDAGEGVWLRATFDFSAGGASARDVAASVTSVVGAWTLYVDGQVIASAGDAKADRPAPLQPVFVSIPPSLAERGQVSLLLHTWRPARLRAALLPRVYQNPVAIGPAAAVRSDMERERLAVGRTQEHWAILACLLGALGLYHVYLYRRRRELNGYLWYGLFLLALCLWTGSNALGRSPFGIEVGRIAALPGGLSTLAIAVNLEFFWRFLRGRAPSLGWRILQGALVLMALVHVVFGSHAYLFVVPPTREVLTSAAMLGGVWVAAREAYRGNRDARTIVWGTSAAVGCAVLQFVRQLSITDASGSSHDMTLVFLGIVLLVFAMGIALANNFTRVLENLAATHQAARRFVPFEFLELLGKPSIVEVRKGDQVELEMSVLFTDLRGFTTLSEKMGPKKTFSVINRYLGHMAPEIHAEGGFIDKTLGDGIMALFHTGSDAAVRAALAMVRALGEMNEESDDCTPRLEMGLGIHSGPLTLGTIGAETRLDCTVIGDTANLASRVESMTKYYGATLLITEATKVRLTSPCPFQLREVDLVQAKGKTEPIRIYEVVDAEPVDAQERKRVGAVGFADALAAYRRGEFLAAKEAFAACAERDPTDASARLYVERCDVLVEAPPAMWDGVTRLEGK